MNNKLRVALIGSGYFSHFHVHAWQRMDDVELIALHSHDQQSAKQLQQNFQIPQLYDNVSHLLQHSNADLIDIVTPPQSHATLIRQCIEHDKAVICQKPFCNSVAEAGNLVEEINSKDALVIVHENFRFQPWYQHIKNILNNQQLGDLYEISFNLRPGDGQGPDAYLARQPYFQQQSRFLIQETAIHFIDVFRYLMGDISGLFAKLDRLNPVMAGEDAGLVMFEFTSGARGLLNANRLSDHNAKDCRLTMGELSIEGSDATLTLDGNAQIHIRAHGDTERQLQNYAWTNTDFGGDCVYRTNRHVADYFLNQTPLHNTAKEYLINREIEERIYHSAQTGEWQTLVLFLAPKALKIADRCALTVFSEICKLAEIVLFGLPCNKYLSTSRCRSDKAFKISDSDAPTGGRPALTALTEVTSRGKNIPPAKISLIAASSS